MKKVLGFIIIIIASLSCNTNRQVTTTGAQVGLVNLSHYYLKNSVELNSNYNGMIISNDNDFRSLFYAENPNGKAVATPDFRGQLVIALALNRTGNDKMVFSKAEITNKAINVYGKQETVQSETDSPVAVATVPKCSDAKRVNFFIDGVLVKTVAMSFKNNSGIYATNENKARPAAPKEERKILAVI